MANLIDAEDFNIEKYDASQIIDITRQNTYNQYTMFPTYDKKSFYVRTKPIRLSRGGIAKKHNMWRPNDADCMFFKLWHDSEDPGSDELFKKVLYPIDAYHKKKSK